MIAKDTKATLEALLRMAERTSRTRARAAERDVARLVKLRPVIAAEFHAMGVLLIRIRDARVARLLGHRDLYDLAGARASLGRRDVADLIAIAASMTEPQARELGWRLAAAYAALARAAGSRPHALYRHGLGGREGARLDPRERRTRLVLEAAKTLRQRAGTARGGRTTSAAERAQAKRLASALRGAGHAARVEAVATRPGRPSSFRVLDLDGAALAFLTRAAIRRISGTARRG